MLAAVKGNVEALPELCRQMLMRSIGGAGERVTVCDCVCVCVCVCV